MCVYVCVCVYTYKEYPLSGVLKLRPDCYVRVCACVCNLRRMAPVGVCSLSVQSGLATTPHLPTVCCYRSTPMVFLQVRVCVCVYVCLDTFTHIHIRSGYAAQHPWHSRRYVCVYVCMYIGTHIRMHIPLQPADVAQHPWPSRRHVCVYVYKYANI